MGPKLSFVNNKYIFLQKNFRILKQIFLLSLLILLIIFTQCFVPVLHQWRTQEFCSGGRGSTNSVEDRGQRERGSGSGSHLVRYSGSSRNLVQEISFHIVKFS